MKHIGWVVQSRRAIHPKSEWAFEQKTFKRTRKDTIRIYESMHGWDYAHQKKRGFVRCVQIYVEDK